MTKSNSSPKSKSPWLYPLAVKAEEMIKWHSFSEKENSSQALCLSAFGSLRADEFAEVRDHSVAQLAGTAFSTMQTASRPRRWEIQVEAEDTSLLSEIGSSQPTSIDALLTSSKEVIAIEAKFDRDASEGFGICGQYKAKKCAGFYGPGSDKATQTSAWCRLENWDRQRSPRAYWALAKRFFQPSVFTEQSCGGICPLRGSNYQLMRNFLFAAAYAEKHGKCSFGVIVICPAKNGRILEGQLSEFLDHVLLPEYYDSIKLLHYENWTEILSGNVGHEESLKLAAFLMDRIESVRCKTTSKA